MGGLGTETQHEGFFFEALRRKEERRQVLARLPMGERVLLIQKLHERHLWFREHREQFRAQVSGHGASNPGRRGLEGPRNEDRVIDEGQ